MPIFLFENLRDYRTSERLVLSFFVFIPFIVLDFQYLSILFCVIFVIVNSFLINQAIDYKIGNTSILSLILFIIGLITSHHLLVSGDLNFILLLILIYPMYLVFSFVFKVETLQLLKNRNLSILIILILICGVYDFQKLSLNNIREIHGIETPEGQGVVFGGTS